MAVKRVAREEEPETIDIELAKLKTYIHPSGMTFVTGGVYTVDLGDARELLGKHDAWGVPYFRKHVPPESIPRKRAEDEPPVAGEGIVKLPANMKKGAAADGDEVPEKPKAKAPKVRKKKEPADEPAPAAMGDTDETDTADGIDI